MEDFKDKFWKSNNSEEEKEQRTKSLEKHIRKVRLEEYRLNRLLCIRGDGEDESTE